MNDRLRLWTRPDCYIGAEWPETYVFLGQHRDSDSLDRSNFRSALAAIGGESETVHVITENHWAVGWVSWIGIDATDSAAVAAASAILDALDDYPIVDEDDHSKVEWEECAETWENCYSPRERFEYMCDHVGRRSLLEFGGFRSIRAAVAGDWHEAANLLPSPSCLIY